MVVKKATLSGRKRTKDLSGGLSENISKNLSNMVMKDVIENMPNNKDVTADKHLELKKLKSDIDKISKPVSKSISKSNLNNQKNKQEIIPKILNPINIKSNINSIVRLYKRNAEAGTRFTLKYTRFEQRDMLLRRVDILIKEYSDYGQESGFSRSENMISCQAYADQIYQALNKAGAPIKPLVVSDPLGSVEV